MASSDEWQQKNYWDKKPLFCTSIKKQLAHDNFIFDNNLNMMKLKKHIDDELPENKRP